MKIIASKVFLSHKCEGPALFETWLSSLGQGFQRSWAVVNFESISANPVFHRTLFTGSTQVYVVFILSV